MYPGFTDYSAPSQFNAGPNGPSSNDSPSSFGGMTPTGNTGLNYTNNTSEHIRLLSGAERKELEVPRELYVNIKMLEVLEKAFTFEKVSEPEYQLRTDNILKKMEKLTQILRQKNPSLTIETFIQEYGLSDCTWAIQRIKKGKGQEATGQNLHGLVATITSRFIKLPDYLLMNSDSAQVKDVLPMLQEMKQLLDMLKPHFSKPGHPFNLGDRFGPVIVKMSAMGLNDILSLELVDEIQGLNDFAKNSFEVYLR